MNKIKDSNDVTVVMKEHVENCATCKSNTIDRADGFTEVALCAQAVELYGYQTMHSPTKTKTLQEIGKCLDDHLATCKSGCTMLPDNTMIAICSDGKTVANEYYEAQKAAMNYNVTVTNEL